MRNNGCTGKTRYRDHKQAMDALQCLQRVSTREVIPHRVYYCHRCKGWHGTSKRNSSDRAKEAQVG